MIYRFVVVRSNLSTVEFQRDLPDDFAATNWMGSEIMSPGDTMEAFRGGEETPFARRRFASDVEVFA